ncbi:hypothetical protein GJU43_21890 [Flavobacterium sp. LC2016-23]|uniref:hypothetical protein n=1 Tax=Flavobacterium sp. LC2016-23 TaxID=2666330 RepID=UPI0012B09C4B|nr:hypothetical protein [Flavobacterium sp. LC2016-23]MRX41939.1 hypothetical protein [Flavobacterium sp. LC2016-23]
MFKFLLSDNESLGKYLHGKFASFDDVKRRMLLKSRGQNSALPDHLYRLEQEETFKDIESLSDIFIKGLGKMADTYLELEAKRVFVKSEQQNNWQETITYIPPLLLQCALLYKKTYSDCKNNISERHKYFKDYLLPNTRYTSIPHARIPQLEYYVKQQNGLHDLHMHLNGALETDQVWQDFLFNPYGIYEDLKKGFRNSKVQEQMEQESHLLEPLTYVTLLKAAQKLRNYFFYYLYPYKDNEYDKYDRNTLLDEFLSNDSDLSGSYRHPFLSLITYEDNHSCLMSVEGLMYILMFHEISNTKNELLAVFFHFYLLILGLTNRLLVQQTHQNGFEQFQKHTLNELREKSEKTYLRRYHQMQGNDLKHIRFLEGRFSPKATQNEMIVFLDAINNGWNKMKEDISLQHESEIGVFPVMPELRLIAHFIKKTDNKPDHFVRHKALRYEVAQRGNVLALLLKNYSKYQKKIVAVDAAASEFDAPPEVFAPVFRKMRRAGVKHFTYHAGEDFYHILSGMRAIYEAIVFCDLQKGDRIGHATASGLSPWQWQNAIGKELLVKQGDYLDDLIFSYHLIVKRRIESLHILLPFIINEVNNMCFNIYNDHYPITLLEQAWLMRQCCPIHALDKSRENVMLKHVYDEEEWFFMVNKGFADTRTSNKVFEVFEAYHNLDNRKKFDKIIKIDPFDIIKAEHVELLQLELLNEMTKKEIVIETLPTSNVRIGFHQNFSTYHLFNWAKWHDEGKSIPPIVVGSDDTGIFATNIYNEYANIYCALLNTHHMPHSKVMSIIKRLDEDSRIYRFE